MEAWEGVADAKEESVIEVATTLRVEADGVEVNGVVLTHAGNGTVIYVPQPRPRLCPARRRAPAPKDIGPGPTIFDHGSGRPHTQHTLVFIIRPHPRTHPTTHPPTKSPTHPTTHPPNPRPRYVRFTLLSSVVCTQYSTILDAAGVRRASTGSTSADPELADLLPQGLPQVTAAAAPVGGGVRRAGA